MGKKKGKNADPEKRAALQAKKEARADKKAIKRLQKEAGSTTAIESTSCSSSTTTSNNQQQQQQQQQLLEALLEQYRQQDEQTTTLTTARVETIIGFPPARANATLIVTDESKRTKAEIYLFGGEYHDGVENIVLNQLFRFDLQEWKRIYIPKPNPPIRCAHSCVYYNQCIYIVGGEMATRDEYIHYKDVWKYNIKTQVWTEIKSMKGIGGTIPTPRSGHSAVVWRHYMIVFGGFYEAKRDIPRWFNDITVMDLQTEQWMDIPHSKLTQRPEPRSNCNVAIIRGDQMIIHGGFSKLDRNQSQQMSQQQHQHKQQQQQQQDGEDMIPWSSETRVHTDVWILHLKPLLVGKPPTWERWMGSSSTSSLSSIITSPNGRSGTSCVPYQDNRLLVFGGVMDTERHHHEVQSIFYNDLWILDIDKRKWFPLLLRSNNPTAAQRTTKTKSTNNNHATAISLNKVETPIQVHEENPDNDDGDDDDDDVANMDLLSLMDTNTQQTSMIATDTGWDLSKLRSNMFAFRDGNGNWVYERNALDGNDQVDHQNDNDDDEEEKEEEKSDHDDDDQSSNKRKHPIEDKGKVDGKKNIIGQERIMESLTMKVNTQTNQPEPIEQPREPLPRMNASMFLLGHVLYLYGGILEVGDREVTLDDLWCLDLRKRQQWECIYVGSMHQQIWRGFILDDDSDSYYSTPGSNGINETKESDDDYDDEEDDHDDIVVDVAAAASVDVNDIVNSNTCQQDKKITKSISTTNKTDIVPSKKKVSLKDKLKRIKDEIQALNVRYDLSNDHRTPRPNEDLKTFYTRTMTYWTGQATTSTRTIPTTTATDSMIDDGSNGNSIKEMCHKGFLLAKDQYELLEPTLQYVQKLLTQHDLLKNKIQQEKKEKGNV